MHTRGYLDVRMHVLLQTKSGLKLKDTWTWICCCCNSLHVFLSIYITKDNLFLHTTKSFERLTDPVLHSFFLILIKRPLSWNYIISITTPYCLTQAYTITPSSWRNVIYVMYGYSVCIWHWVPVTCTTLRTLSCLVRPGIMRPYTGHDSTDNRSRQANTAW